MLPRRSPGVVIRLLSSELSGLRPSGTGPSAVIRCRVATSVPTYHAHTVLRSRYVRSFRLNDIHLQPPLTSIIIHACTKHARIASSGQPCYLTQHVPRHPLHLSPFYCQDRHAPPSSTFVLICPDYIRVLCFIQYGRRTCPCPPGSSEAR